jgi:hypothetical protein
LDSTYKTPKILNACRITHTTTGGKESDTMKKVTVYIQFEEKHKPFEGYLLDSQNVIYIGEGSLKLVGVRLKDDWKYIQNTGHIILGKASDNMNEELLVHSVINRLKNTTVYDYLLSKWDRSEDVDFEFIN